ncbi:methyltransferase domain-containing protein [Mastigocoleus testarum]|uniref:SAM-dependent methyltransferase n=1 Tax=Mastigocoleus testarum BC008 TaxID=371196 RepID=A0A0V7ZPY1_9CYAN|nr:methyltransferase domain-containing protein [Mastigocoleus testarum]KST66772.1 SAM-dependent methyltransferase [Mastigocoleus testarum BC008]
MTLTDNPDYWENRYQENNTPWDLGQAAPAFISLLHSENPPEPGRAAVLGCGRGYDVLIFAERGFDVIGFDFSASAIEDAQIIADTAGTSARFMQRDIFDLSAEFENYFDYVIEHTCFCAINPQKRFDYVNVVNSILKPEGEMIAVFFTHNRPGGPPYGIAPAQIKQYMHRSFETISLRPVINSVPKRIDEEYLGRFRPIQSSETFGEN